MSQLLFRNFSLLDPRWDEPRGGYEVLVDGEHIKEVSAKPIKARGAQVVDGGGKRTLMPGLIDSHVHVFLTEVNIGHLEAIPLTLMTAKSSQLMKGMIDRGFTTVRDTGGADWGIKTAVDLGLIPGPRLFISAKAIGPTGGHSDPRRRTDYQQASCGCCNGMVYVMAVANGADEVRKCVREQMRQGADQIKIMCSGGVASPYDPLEFAAVLGGRDRRRHRRGEEFRPLCAGSCLHARGDHARHEQRRAHHRARQPDRREVGQAASRARAAT